MELGGAIVDFNCILPVIYTMGPHGWFFYVHSCCGMIHYHAGNGGINRRNVTSMGGFATSAGDRGFRDLDPPVILGTGADGEARVVCDDEGFQYVMKHFHPQNSAYQSYKDESIMLRRVAGCSNVQQIVDCWDSPDGYYIISEYCTGPRLHSMNGITEYDMARFLVQIYIALCAIHAQGVAHTDNHRGNVVTDSNGNFVLIDFSYAAAVNTQRVLYDWTKFGNVAEYMRDMVHGVAKGSKFMSRINELLRLIGEKTNGRMSFDSDQWHRLEKEIGMAISEIVVEMHNIEEREFLLHMLNVGVIEYLVLAERRGMPRGNR